MTAPIPTEISAEIKRLLEFGGSRQVLAILTTPRANEWVAIWDSCGRKGTSLVVDDGIKVRVTRSD